MASQFEETFNRLVLRGGKPSSDTYLVLGLGNELSNWFVGIDDQSYPCILISSAAVVGKQPAPIKLENLDVQFHVPCKIERAIDLVSQSTCSVIRLKLNDGPMRSVFFSICDTMALMLGNTPRDTDLSKAMKRLAAIFRRMLAPPSRTLAGLFGELVIIYRSMLPHELIRDWRITDTDRYDFSSNDFKLEVKSSSVRRRTHEFSFEQCSPPVGVIGLVASVFVERSGRGTTVFDLQKLIEMRLSRKLEAIFKLREVIANSLGNGQSQGAEIEFDLTLAIGSVNFYHMREIPAIRESVPVNVSRVRFTSDLSGVQPIDMLKMSDGNPSLAAYLDDSE